MLWKNVRCVGEGFWGILRIVGVTEFVFQEENIQTVMQNVLFSQMKESG